MKCVDLQYDGHQCIAGTVKAVILVRWPFIPHHPAEIKNETSTKNAVGKKNTNVAQKYCSSIFAHQKADHAKHDLLEQKHCGSSRNTFEKKEKNDTAVL